MFACKNAWVGGGWAHACHKLMRVSALQALERSEKETSKGGWGDGLAVDGAFAVANSCSSSKHMQREYEKT